MSQITDREAEDLAHETLLSKGQAFVVLGLKRDMSLKEINREMGMDIHRPARQLHNEVQTIRRELPDEIEKTKRTVEAVEGI